jgi:hypothetical protein
VLFQKIPQVHPVQLIPGEDQIILGFLGSEMDKIFPNGIGGTFKPRGMLKCLFRREDFNKTVGKNVKGIGLGQMKVEGSGIELGKHINLPQIGINAV